MTQPVYTPPLAEYEEWGQHFVAAQFNVAAQAYVIAFHEISSELEMHTKGYDIKLPGFEFPAAGMTEVMFDTISDLTGEGFGDYSHVNPSQGVSPIALLKVITLIEHHYNCRKPGGYLFYAATTVQDTNRITDLKLVYDRMLGVAPKKNGEVSRVASRLPAGWKVISELSRGGRGYAIIC